jgi:hypothetical protein
MVSPAIIYPPEFTLAQECHPRACGGEGRIFPAISMPYFPLIIFTEGDNISLNQFWSGL